MSDDTEKKVGVSGETSLVDRFVDSSLHPEIEQKNAGLKITLFVLAYSVFAVLNPLIILFPSFKFLLVVRGVFSMVQLLLSVLIVLDLNIKGFRAVLVVTILQIAMSLFVLLRYRDEYAINGLTCTILSLVIVLIVIAYNRRLAMEVERVESKTRDLETANVELKNREDEMKRQNSLLTEYNHAMKENEERLYQMNHFDALTGLPNRVKISDRIDLLISLFSNQNMSFALIYIDLDNFKGINDSMGHQVGDAMLQAVSTRLMAKIHPEDMLGRWGGDEFALLVQRQFTDEEMLTYVEMIRDSFTIPFQIDDSEYNMSASFGIAVFPQDGTTSVELIKCAETAMYKSKELGKNMVQFYRKEMKDDIMRRIKYESRLLNSIKNEELYLCYQPQYDIKEQKLRGFEALCRWNSEKFGEVNPGEFIPVAESVGFVVPLGEWVLEQACLTYNHLAEEYGWDGVMSVNISPVQLMSPMFLQSVKRILARTQIDPVHLEFEVTESVMVSNVDYVVKLLKEIAEMGITVALDDFGTGYSSLNYLHQLPIHVLKIDKSFVDELPIKDTQRLMVGSIIGLVHQMDILVVAEGVDDRRQLDVLTKYNCDFIQGYIWGRPITDNEVDALFQKHQN